MLFEDQLAALDARLAARSARSGGEHRLRAAGRRPGGRARAGHHHRRRLPLLLHRPAQVHRRRHARPRAVHAQHGDRRLDRRPRGDPDRRAQGRADADAAAQLPRRRCSASATSCWRSTRWTWSDYARDGVRRDRRRTTARSPPAIGLADVTAIPISALHGDNIIDASAAHALVPRARRCWSIWRPSRSTRTGCSGSRSACRCSGSTGPNLDFRGFAGTIASGTRRARATRIRVLPSGRESHGRAHRHHGRRSRRGRRRPVGDADAGRRDRRPRGDVHRRRRRAAEVADQFEATLVWMGEEPMLPGPPLPAEDRHAHGRRRTVTPLKYKVNVNTLEHLAATTLELNEIGVVQPRASTARSPSIPTRRTATSAASS